MRFRVRLMPVHLLLLALALGLVVYLAIVGGNAIAWCLAALLLAAELFLFVPMVFFGRYHLQQTLLHVRCWPLVNQQIPYASMFEVKILETDKHKVRIGFMLGERKCMIDLSPAKPQQFVSEVWSRVKQAKKA